MTTEHDTDPIRDALRELRDPVSGRNIVEAGLVAGIVRHENEVGLQLCVTPETHAACAGLAEAARRLLLERFSSLSEVKIVFTSEVDAAELPPRRAAQWNATPIPHVKRLLAIASGKGGVGKSSVAVGLAHAFVAKGMRIGLLDADIHGPSIPRMLGKSEKPQAENGHLIPLVAHGIAFLSTGLLIAEREAAVMRGPMVAKTLQQFLRGAVWGTPEKPLDLLILDLPPGTGDVQLSLAQNVPLSAPGNGALIVTTSSAVALADARKAANMFEKIGVPILGVIENMSWLETLEGARSFLFGEGGGAALAAEIGAPLLGQLPFDPAFGRALDQGEKPSLAGFEAVAGTLLPARY